MHPMIASWNQVAEAFGQRLDAMSADKIDARTPCDQWSCAELVEHATSVQHSVGASLGVTPDADAAPAASWQGFRTALVEALSADGALEEEVDTPFGMRPRAEALGIPMMDMLVHTWDLARTLDVDDSLPEEIVAHAFDQLKPMDAMIRQPGMFAEKVEAPAGASLQDQFIAFTGRQP